MLSIPDPEKDIFTVSRLNREVKTLLESYRPSLWIQGEISNLSRPASGHIYFSLKDEGAQVRCALFKNRNMQLAFMPADGVEVLVCANISLYERRGDYQLIVQSLKPVGAGALLHAFKLLQEKLAKQGLFATEHKQELPRYPETIGIISSPTGAAIRDILNVLSRRYPLAKIILYPTLVQGAEAGSEIARMLSIANDRNECDVLILARGGGTIEDLWAFNDERLARAIYDCQIPLVSGIGHQIDFTIADFVADKRGATPSAAAELISPNSTEIVAALSSYRARLKKQIEQILLTQRYRTEIQAKRISDPIRKIQQFHQRLDEYAARLLLSIRLVCTKKRAALNASENRSSQLNPVHRLKRLKEKNDYLYACLNRNMNAQLQRLQQRLARLQQALHMLSPLQILNRGYAIVTDLKNNRIIRDAKTLKKGDKALIRLSRGQLVAVIERSK